MFATWSHSAAGPDQLTATVLHKTVEFCIVSKLTSSHPKHSTTPPALLNGIWGWSSHWLIFAFLVIILVWGGFIFWTYGIKEKDYTVSSTSDSNGKYAKRANRAVICILQSKTMKKKGKNFHNFCWSLTLGTAGRKFQHSHWSRQLCRILWLLTWLAN